MAIVSIGMAIGAFASERAIGVFDLMNCLVLIMTTCKIHSTLRITTDLELRLGSDGSLRYYFWTIIIYALSALVMLIWLIIELKNLKK